MAAVVARVRIVMVFVPTGRIGLGPSSVQEISSIKLKAGLSTLGKRLFTSLGTLACARGAKTEKRATRARFQHEIHECYDVKPSQYLLISTGGGPIGAKSAKV